MGGSSFVLVCDYPIDKSAADIDLLKNFLKDVPETTIFVFWYDSLEFETKNNAKLKAVLNAFAKAGDAVRIDKRSDSKRLQKTLSLNFC